MLKKTFLFLILNFTALALGGLFTGSGVASQWYQNLHKAPWTPPGWIFGSAWTLIMICFSIYMAYLISQSNQGKKIISLFVIQWILNVAWNPVFFYYNNITAGLFIIVSLTFLVGYFLFQFKKDLGIKSLLIAPYFIWLIIATSLNAYILLYN